MNEHQSKHNHLVPYPVPYEFPKGKKRLGNFRMQVNLNNKNVDARFETIEKIYESLGQYYSFLCTSFSGHLCRR